MNHPTVSQSAWNEEYDIVVLGSGAAGLTAALVAAVEGMRTLLIEKSPHVGGTTINELRSQPQAPEGEPPVENGSVLRVVTKGFFAFEEMRDFQKVPMKEPRKGAGAHVVTDAGP